MKSLKLPNHPFYKRRASVNKMTVYAVMSSNVQEFFCYYISFCINVVKYLCVVICTIFVNLPLTAKKDIFSVSVVCDHCPFTGKPKFFVLKQF